MTKSISTTKNIMQLTPNVSMLQTEDLYIAKSHWISFVKPILYIIISMIGMLLFFKINGWFKYIVGSAFFLMFYNALNTFIYYKTLTIILKKRQISVCFGWLTKNQLDIPVYRREGVLVSQSILGRILNYGNITISTGGVATKHIISNPNELRKELYNQMI